MKRAADGPSSAPGDAKRARHAHAMVVVPPRPISTHLDIDELIAARKSDILALHRAMKQADAATNTRAWQLLPRHLRRRAASHNVLRLPRRLRNKARAELRASNTAAMTRSEMRRRMPERTLHAYVRRRAALKARAARAGRRWLETHLWHAKRFRMSGEKGTSDGGAGRFGFCLAESPHHKSFRTTWRQTAQATVHDASYTSVFYVCARARRVADATSRLQLFLARAGAEHGWETSWTSGAQLCHTILLAKQAICPVQVLWIPRVVGRTRRACLLFVHPAASKDVRRALQKAHDALQCRRTGPIPQRWDRHVDIQAHQVDMAPSPAVAAGVWHSDASQRPPATPHARGRTLATTDGWNIFDLMGHRSAHILRRVLHPAESAVPAQSAMLRAALESHTLLPPHTVLTCDVTDPRLDAPDVPPAPPIASLCDDDVPRYTDARFFSCRHALPATTASIDRRRARGDTRAHGTQDTLTIMLIQRSIEPSPGPGHMFGYTLLVPRGWGAIYLHALARASALVVGQEQLRELYLNLGLPLFPYDWVGHPAHMALAEAGRARRAAQWQARPPAKRVRLDDEGLAYAFGGPALWTTLGRAQPRRPVILPAPTRIPRSPRIRPMVLVLLVACRRGAFDENATMHVPEADLLPQWRAALDPPTSRKTIARQELQTLEATPVARSSAVGAVTTGHYALATGHGRAMGAMDLDAWLELERRCEPPRPPTWGRWKRNRVPLERLVLVRPAMTETPVRAASVSLVRL